jgi:hypothetical protein
MSHGENKNLLEAILAGLSDTRMLGDHTGGPSPLDELIKGYHRAAKNDDRLPAISGDSTGRELKDALSLLAPEMQVELLARYNHATKNLLTPTEYDPKVISAETKGLRSQIYWLGGILLFFMLSVLIGVVLTTAVHMQVISEGSALHNLIGSAKEIIELFLDIETG